MPKLKHIASPLAKPMNRAQTARTGIGPVDLIKLTLVALPTCRRHAISRSPFCTPMHEDHLLHTRLQCLRLAHASFSPTHAPGHAKHGLTQWPTSTSRHITCRHQLCVKTTSTCNLPKSNKHLSSLLRLDSTTTPAGILPITCQSSRPLHWVGIKLASVSSMRWIQISSSLTGKASMQFSHRSVPSPTVAFPLFLTLHGPYAW